MPIVDSNEAKDLDEAIERLIRAGSAADRETRLRSVFVEKLDFSPAGGIIDLRGERCPTDQAVRIAEAEGVHVVWAPLSSVRILISDTRAVSKALTGLLGDHLLVASSEDGDVWHLIYPASAGAKSILRRMVVERGLPRRTVVTQLAKVYHEAQKADVRHALESAYDVEPVTKEFFTTYHAVFERVMEMVQGVPDAEDRRLFCQALFNRLMFLYFLQRKGWLKFNGDSNYLPSLLRASKAAGKENFFHDRLKVLFFEGLNNPQNVGVSRGASPAIGDVPFLNGGLFEEGEIDHKCAVAEVPNEAFDLILGGLFERFNFTVSENTPYDIEVAVDPEMLGKVFEELVTGRHETGSYYTPRPVVAFMCREVLKGYLESKVAGLSPDAIHTFVGEHDVSGLDFTQADAVSEALDEVTVCDPACGSGAYLVGMLHELIELKQALYSERLGRDPTKLYDMKLHVIERNLYGTDIDEFAINVAMLRLWLSLIIDFEGETPPPLPNLDFKIVCGDSLTAPNPQQAPDLFRHAVHAAADNLADLKGRYMRESGPNKSAIRRQIEAAEEGLKRALSESPAPREAVDWRVEFADVFEHAGGFDVVLANPPYVSALAFTRTRSASEREAIRRLYVTASGAWDLYVPFFERGIQILRSGGQLAYVSPNKYLSASYASAMREFIRHNTCFRQLVDLTRIEVFESASVYPVLTFLSRGSDEHRAIVCRLPSAAPGPNVDPMTFDAFETRQSTLDLFPDHLWGFLLSNRLDLLTRLLAETVPLSSVADVRATTTAAEADSYGNRLAESRTQGDLFRVVNTGTIDSFRSLWGRADLRDSGRAFRKPILSPNDVSDGRRKLYSAPKVLFAKIAKRCEAFLDSAGTYAGLNVNCVANPHHGMTLEFICGYSNSRVFMFFYNQLFGALRMSGGYYQFQAPQLRSMPIPKVDPKSESDITALTQRISSAFENGSTSEAEALIEDLDRRVASAVGLTDAEFNSITPEGDPLSLEKHKGAPNASETAATADS